jgi:hypothetical protein
MNTRWHRITKTDPEEGLLVHSVACENVSLGIKPFDAESL